MKKYFDAVRGLGLAFSGIKVFDLNVLRSRRVAIIGPASSAFNTGKGGFIDNFDIVIRVNKSALTVDSSRHSGDIGTRTDILFHCFLENMYSGGGPLDFGMYERQGIKYVVNPRNEWSGLRSSFNFYKKYLSPTVTYVLPRKLYSEISNAMGGYRPTTGFSALFAALESQFSELYIAGFTFFKTAYGTGYRDEMKEANQARDFMKQVGLHNPDVELDEFKKLLRRHATKNIHLDQELQTIVEKY